MNKLKNMILGGATAVLTFLITKTTHAANNGFIPVPSSVGQGRGFTLTDLTSIVNNLATWLMELGVALAVIFIIWGGIQYMLAGGDEEKSTKARGRIFNGIIGAAVVIGVGIIIRTIMVLVTPQGGIYQ